MAELICKRRSEEFMATTKYNLPSSMQRKFNYLRLN